MTRISFAVALLLLAACAGPYHGPRTVRVVNYSDKDGIVVGNAYTVLPDDTLLCTEETPTGTHVSRRVCRFEQESLMLREQTHEVLRRAMTGGSTRSALAAESGASAGR